MVIQVWPPTKKRANEIVHFEFLSRDIFLICIFSLIFRLSLVNLNEIVCLVGQWKELCDLINSDQHTVIVNLNVSDDSKKVCFF